MTLLGGAAVAWPCVGDWCELAHTRPGLRAIFLAPEGLILGMGAISGGLVSQRREKPNARSQKSFDRNEDENARWSGAQATLRSGTAARNMQARTRRGAGAAGGDRRGAQGNQPFCFRSPAGARYARGISCSSVRR